jgi:chromosome segregation ATPase
MKTTEIITGDVPAGALNEMHLTELADHMDPAIGEATAVMGAMATEIIRRSLRGGVLQIGRELSTYVGQQVEHEIREQRPMIEKTAAETATEVARGEVDAVREAADKQGQQLAERIDDATRQAQTQAETVARDLGGRLDETARQTHEVTASLAKTLETEVAGVGTRIDATRKELTSEFDGFKDRARQATAKLKERLDHLETAASDFADQQRAFKTEQERLLQEIGALRRTNAALAQRVEVLEQPRGIRRFFAWLFGRKKKPAVVAAGAESGMGT